MSDFEDALQQRLSGNDELAQRRAAAEQEMQRIADAAKASKADVAQSKVDQHATLAAHLESVAGRLKASKPDSFIVRTGWTASGEEFLTRISTRQMSPKRTLLVEVDRDDDEVLARWTSDIGNAVEIWRLLEVSPEMITEMVLQVADDTVWIGNRPPAFPSEDAAQA